MHHRLTQPVSWRRYHDRLSFITTPANRTPRHRPPAIMQGTDELPARIWATATTDPRLLAAARIRLAGLGVWPPAARLPPATRWLAREDAARLDLHLPEDADGAVVYAFAVPGRIGAVQLDALNRDGRLPAKRWRHTYSIMRGAAFHVPGPDGPHYAVHVAAGPPVDALAIATWRQRQAWAAFGPGDLAALAPVLAATGRKIVIEANADGPGGGAAEALQAALQRRGARVRLVSWPGCSPADGLTDEWQERAAFAEADGMDCREAAAAAWRAMMYVRTMTEHPAENR